MIVPAQLQDTAPREPGSNKLTGAPKWWQSLQRIYQLVAKAINGNIEFGNPTSGSVNINGVWVAATTPAGVNTDFTVTHNLGRPVAGYWVMQSDAACDIYTSPTPNPNPNTQFILRDTFGVAHIIIFFV